jgi:hypothetical protein
MNDRQPVLRIPGWVKRKAQVARGGVPRERLHELLGRPPSGGGVGDVDLDDTSPVRQDDEDEQDLEQYRGHGEEVHGDEAPNVVGEERTPRPRWRRSTADQVLGDRGLRDLEAELLELAVDPGCAPQGVGASHVSDERADVRRDGGVAGPRPAALPGPEELEASPLPPDHRGGLDDGDGIVPAGPQAGQQDPEQAVAARSMLPRQTQ